MELIKYRDDSQGSNWWVDDTIEFLIKNSGPDHIPDFQETKLSEELKEQFGICVEVLKKSSDKIFLDGNLKDADLRTISDSHTRKGNLFKDDYGPKSLSTVRFNTDLMNHVFGDNF